MEGELIKKNTWLTPLSWMYGLVVFLRNRFFDWGVLKSKKYDIPIISVGNLTIGGTGKTPHIEYLIKLLSKRYKVAVLSRGYKRKSNGYILANEETPMEFIGDESWQIKQKFPDIYVAVDANRCHGIEQLMKDKSTRDVQIILLDDAFQHRHVTPGRNILLTDYHRLFSKDSLLPVGRLREPASGKERANMVIVTKCPANMSPMDYRIIAESLKLRPYQQLYFSSIKYGRLVNLYTQDTKSMAELSKYNVLLLTGIGCPKQMNIDMSQRFASVKSIDFSDHHYYSQSDISYIAEEIKKIPEPRLIITTEKDTTKLVSLDDIPTHLSKLIWILPIGVCILQEKEKLFNDKITGYVQKNLRNC
ncbi:MAG: tetraacyldisaccharide 4'-kinase [Bacteroidaceae bacterium]|nr:tetraacyldisaccharide 4'-kinase [Bacteroidaceae bacterium]